MIVAMHDMILLIKKDLINLLAIFWWFPTALFLMSLVFGVVSVPFVITFIPAIWIYIGCYNLFAVEERYQSQVLAFTLPIRMERFVTARFVLCVGGCAFFCGVGAVANTVNQLLNGLPTQGLTIFLQGLSVGAILCSVMIGSIFVVGPSKSKLVGIFIYLFAILVLPNNAVVTGGLATLASKGNTGLLGLVLSSLLILLISYAISVRMFLKRHLADI